MEKPFHYVEDFALWRTLSTMEKSFHYEEVFVKRPYDKECLPQALLAKSVCHKVIWHRVFVTGPFWQRVFAEGP